MELFWRYFHFEMNPDEDAEESYIEHNDHTVSRYEWLGTAFAEIAVTDTAATLKAFPIDW